MIRVYGYTSKDPDWPNTFILPHEMFMKALILVCKHIESIDRGLKNGYWYLILDGKYRLRGDFPEDPYKILWEEMNEKDSTKPTDL